MTRDEFIRMAREADATVFLAPYYIGSLERFAELVAEHEREACAAICDYLSGSDYLPNQCAEAIRTRGEK